MIKIFFNDKILILSENMLSENFITKISFSDKEYIKNSINNFITCKDNQSLNIYGDNEGVILAEIERFFTKILAAGGIVKNNSNELLFINRLNMWDLPKGKIEHAETPEHAAIREVCEECGIIEQDLTLQKLIEKTYHIYVLNNKIMLKETFWFEMFFGGNYTLTPQVEEHITSIKWINGNNIDDVLKQTYPSIKLLINDYLSLFPFQ